MEEERRLSGREAVDPRTIVWECGKREKEEGRVEENVAGCETWGKSRERWKETLSVPWCSSPWGQDIQWRPSFLFKAYWRCISILFGCVLALRWGSKWPCFTWETCKIWVMPLLLACCPKTEPLPQPDAPTLQEASIQPSWATDTSGIFWFQLRSWRICSRNYWWILVGRQ